MVLTPVVGLAVAALAIGYEAGTGHSSSDVLFSGETAMGPLLQGSAGYSVGALLMLLVCKSLAYSLSLSSFRGGPVFPSMFLGAAGGVALSHLPGLPLVAGVAMGIGAMCVGWCSAAIGERREPPARSWGDTSQSCSPNTSITPYPCPLPGLAVGPAAAIGRDNMAADDPVAVLATPRGWAR